MNYSTFIQTAKKYANQGESQRLSLMNLLLDTEPRKSLWQEKGAKSWDLLLREEGLCTPTLYHNFKRATKIVDVEIFGVYASAAIANLNSRYRLTIIRRTNIWIRSHKIPPTYQRITKYVVDLRKELGVPVGRRSTLSQLRSENGRLERKLARAEEYIELLRATLKKNSIRVPKEP